jgi:hypothetical protein
MTFTEGGSLCSCCLTVCVEPVPPTVQRLALSTKEDAALLALVHLRRRSLGRWQDQWSMRNVSSISQGHMPVRLAPMQSAMATSPAGCGEGGARWTPIE